MKTVTLLIVVSGMFLGLMAQAQKPSSAPPPGATAQTTPAKESAKPEAAKPEAAKRAPLAPKAITHEEALELQLSDALRDNLNHQFADLQARGNAWAGERAALNKTISEKYKIDITLFQLSPGQDLLVPLQSAGR